MKVYANTSSLKQSSGIQQALHKAKIPSPQKKNKGVYPVYDLIARLMTLFLGLILININN